MLMKAVLQPPVTRFTFTSSKQLTAKEPTDAPPANPLANIVCLPLEPNCLSGRFH